MIGALEGVEVKNPYGNTTVVAIVTLLATVGPAAAKVPSCVSTIRGC
jgi:hypothetical protein